MRKKLMSICLVISMMVGLGPILGTSAGAADPATPSTSTDEMLTPTKVPDSFSSDTTNPYGTKQDAPFLMSTENELVLSTNSSYGSFAYPSDYTFGATSQIGTSGNYLAVNDILGNASNYADRTSISSATAGYAFVSGVALDAAGDGRDDWAAFVGLKDSGIWVWMQNLKTGALTSARPVASAEWLNNLQQFQYKNFFAITAGDYDGDGVDSFMICVPETSGEDLREFRLSGGSISYVESVTGTNPLHPASFANDKPITTMTVSLASGDFDNDGRDEVAAVSGVCDPGDTTAGGSLADLQKAMSWLSVYKHNASGTEYTRQYYHDLATQDATGTKDNSGYTKYNINMIRYAGVSAGDVNNDGRDEVVIAGYLGTGSYMTILGGDKKVTPDIYGTDNDVSESVAYATYYYGTGVSDVSVTAMNTFTNSGLYNDDGVGQDQIHAQAAVTCAAVNGRDAAEYVYIMGTLYTWSGGSLTAVMTSSRDAVSGTSNVWTESAIAGNFDGNDAGREQVISVIGEKKSGVESYAYLVDIMGGLGYSDTASAYGTATGYYENIKMNSAFGADGSDVVRTYTAASAASPLSCVVLAADIDDDGILVKYSGKVYGYSDAAVYAVLQAAPYFGELGGYDDFNNGATTYEITSSKSETETMSNSVSVSVGIGTELQTTATKVEAEIAAAMDWTETYEKSLTISYSDSFTAQGTDTVVLYRVPITTYVYSTYDAKSKTWVCGKNGNGSFGMLVGIPDQPTYLTLSKSAYNSFADTYNNKYASEITAGTVTALTKVDGTITPENDSGNPFCYKATGGEGFQQLSTAIHTIGNGSSYTSSGWSTETSYSAGKEVAWGFNFSLSVQFGLDVGLAEAWLGITTTLDYRHATGTTSTTTKSTGSSGTVQDIDQDGLYKDKGIPTAVSSKYGFSWTFGVWNRTMGGKTTPVFGYVLTGVTAPSPQPTLADVTILNNTQAQITWEAPVQQPGDPRTFTGYNLYTVAGGTYTKLNASPIDKGTLTYTYSGLKTGTNYTFAVTTVNSGGDSVWSNELSVTMPLGEYLLTLSSDPVGSAVVSATFEGSKQAISGQKYQQGTQMTITANAVSGYVITGYRRIGTTSHDYVLTRGATATFQAYLSEDTEYKVLTERVHGTVTYGVNDPDYGTVSAKTAGYDFVSGDYANTSVDLTAVPAEGYVLTGWQTESDGVSALVTASGNTYSFNPVGKANSVTAVFTAIANNKAEVTIKASPKGTITVKDAGGETLTPVNGVLSVMKGSVLTFTSVPAANYAFDKWTDGLSSSGVTNPAAVTVTTAITVGASYYAPTTRTVSFAAYDDTSGTPVISTAAGTVAATQNGSSFASGEGFIPGTTGFMFTAAPASGYIFDHWAVNGTSQAEIGAVLTLPSLAANCSVAAHFVRLPAITTTSLAGGSTNIAYSGTALTGAGPSDCVWSVAYGSLPTGLTLNSKTGAITGTPTAAGRFSFTVQYASAKYALSAQKEFSILVTSFTPITSLTYTGGTSLSAGGDSISLTASIAPADATHRAVTWTVSSNTIGASIRNQSGDYQLSAQSAGSVTVTGTVAGGGTGGADITCSQIITVGAKFVPVAGITGVPESESLKQVSSVWRLCLGDASVVNDNATNKTISWTIVKDFTNFKGVLVTRASEEHEGSTTEYGSVNSSCVETAIAKATVTNGLSPTKDYVEYFLITVSYYNGYNGTEPKAIIPEPSSSMTAGSSIELPLKAFSYLIDHEGNTTWGGTENTTKSADNDYFNIKWEITGGTANAWLEQKDRTLQKSDQTNMTEIGYVLTAANTGSVELKATVDGGKYSDTRMINITANFTVTVNAAVGLSDLSIGGLDLNGQTPKGVVYGHSFTPAIKEYTVTAPGSAYSILVTATFPSGTAVKINGKDAVSGTPQNVAMAVGSNTITVTAGSDTYTITVNRMHSDIGDITGIPAMMKLGESLSMDNLTVTPSDAFSTEIDWKVKDAGTTGVTELHGGISPPTAVGTFILTASAVNSTNSFTKDFSIVVYDPNATSLVAAPTATPTGNVVSGTQEVALSSTTDGAEIHYTTDGTAPTASSAKYSEPIAISVSTQLRAMAIKGSAVSSITEELYTLTGASLASISASSDANSTISPSGSVSAVIGADMTFTIAAKAGYAIDDVKVDGTSVGAVTSYTFKAIAAGTHTIAVTAKSTAAQAEAPALTTASLDAAVVGTAYNASLAATGTAPITWSVTSGSLPGGLTLNAATGAVTGTPTAAGTFNFTVAASNSAGSSSRDLSITVSAAKYTVTVSGSYAQTSGAGSYAQSTSVQIDAGSRTGYVFSGWTSPDGVSFASASSAATTFIMPAKNVQVTAGWTQSSPGTGGTGTVSSFTLTFETAGGSAIAPISKESGASVDLSAYTPTRSGYTFDGWYSDSTLKQAVSAVTLTKDTSVYAKWTEKALDNPFTDVQDNAFYYDAVLWAVDQKITQGKTSTLFAPADDCTRAQVVAFLWRAMGSPEPTSEVNPFTDVSPDAYYYKAVLWAVEKGITKGSSATAFSPEETVTRAEFVTFLWRAAGSPAPVGESKFSDVADKSAYYYSAVVWAGEQGVTSGTSETEFSPEDLCSRGQVVTFLYRYLHK